MGQSRQKLMVIGQTPDPIAAGERVRIDPQLLSSRGFALAPTEVIPSNGFILASIQDDPSDAGSFGTFDVQNISSEDRVCEYAAIHSHSIQYNARTPQQTTLGPKGVSPSPDAAIPGVGGGGSSVITQNFSFAGNNQSWVRFGTANNVWFAGPRFHFLGTDVYTPTTIIGSFSRSNNNPVGQSSYRIVREDDNTVFAFLAAGPNTSTPTEVSMVIDTNNLPAARTLCNVQGLKTGGADARINSLLLTS